MKNLTRKKNKNSSTFYSTDSFKKMAGPILRSFFKSFLSSSKNTSLPSSPTLSCIEQEEDFLHEPHSPISNPSPTLEPKRNEFDISEIDLNSKIPSIIRLSCRPTIYEKFSSSHIDWCRYVISL